MAVDDGVAEEVATLLPAILRTEHSGAQVDNRAGQTTFAVAAAVADCALEAPSRDPRQHAPFRRL